MNLATLVFMCIAHPAQFDMNGIQSFQITFSKDQVMMADVKLSQKALKDIATSTDPKVKAIGIAGVRGFSMNGKMKPYASISAHAPKVRYPLQSRDVSMPILSDLIAYEGQKMTVFVPILNGTPVNQQLYLEYDGTQGPYYDHFDCN